jgi:hypothetical protein
VVSADLIILDCLPAEERRQWVRAGWLLLSPAFAGPPNGQMTRGEYRSPASGGWPLVISSRCVDRG